MDLVPSPEASAAARHEFFARVRTSTRVLFCELRSECFRTKWECLYDQQGAEMARRCDNKNGPLPTEWVKMGEIS
jgi:hypothetical protein